MRTLVAVLVTALWTMGTARAESEEPPQQLLWDWDSPHRFYLETQVTLPQPIWFVAEKNKEQRAVAFQVRAVIDCAAGAVERRKVREILCRVEDIGLIAAGMPKKAELLQPILEEHDERLTGTAVQLQVRSDGRIVNIDLEGLDRRNRRVGSMNENLRIVVSRAVAGLDLQLPKDGHLIDGVWAQYQNQLMLAPSAVGTSGSSETIHKIREERSDGTVLIETAGRGVIVPGESLNNYITVLAAFGTFDVTNGVLLERSWTTIGEPSASSAIAEGGAGINYMQQGRLKLLGADEVVDVGPTIEVAPPGLTPTTLQLWPVFGTTPNPTGL